MNENRHWKIDRKINKKIDKKKTLLMAIVGVAILFIVLNSVRMQNVFELLREISIKYFLLLMATLPIMLFLNTLRLKIITKTFDIKIPFTNLFFYNLAGFSISYLIPSARLAGEPFRAYLMGENKIKLEKALPVVIVDKSIELTLSGLFTSISILILLSKIVLSTSIRVVALINIFLIFLLIFIFYYTTLKGGGFLTRVIKTFRIDRIGIVRRCLPEIRETDKNVAKLLRQGGHYFVFVFLLTMVSWLIMILSYKIALSAFGIELPFYLIILIYFFAGVAFAIPVPIAVGVFEASQVIAAIAVRLSSAVGLSLSLLIRTRDLAWAIIGILYLIIVKRKVIGMIFRFNRKKEGG